jgi:hypothetical protein
MVLTYGRSESQKAPKLKRFKKKIPYKPKKDINR